jgi:FKBP-type peptidyl-prolyl cis-trans isomerase
MKKIAILLVLASTLFSISCSKFLENDIEAVNKKNQQEIQDYISSKNLQMLSTQTGIWYAVSQNTIGRNIAVGDEATIHYSLTLLNGTKIDSTERAANKPIKIIYGGVQIIPGFLEALNTLKEGERGTFLIPSVLGFGSQSSANIPANSVLKLDLETLKLRSEDQQIDEYVKGTKLPLTLTTTSGVRIIKTLETTGTPLKVGLLATVKYTGYLASSITKFDAGQIDVGLGDGTVVKGFEEGLLNLNVGEKAVLVFPSALGYGTKGSGTSIPPYAPLIFTVEIVSAK